MPVLQGTEVSCMRMDTEGMPETKQQAGTEWVRTGHAFLGHCSCLFSALTERLETVCVVALDHIDSLVSWCLSTHLSIREGEGGWGYSAPQAGHCLWQLGDPPGLFLCRADYLLHAPGAFKAGPQNGHADGAQRHEPDSCVEAAKYHITILQHSAFEEKALTGCCTHNP